MSNNLKETLPFERSKGENTAIVLFFKSFEEIPVFQIPSFTYTKQMFPLLFHQVLSMFASPQKRQYSDS